MRSARSKRLLTLGVIVLALLVTGIGVYFGRLIFGDNLHPVISGAVYRSAAPAADSLTRWTRELGLRSIINLKGGHETRAEAWERESRLAGDLGIELRSVRMSAQRWPAPNELTRLIDALADSPRPVLLHCSAGIDRTGLAAAVAMLLEGAPPETAREQFHLRYGYPGEALGSSLPGFIDAYARWLDETGQPHQRERFVEWIHTAYIPGYYEAEIELLTPLVNVAVGPELVFDVRITNRSPLAIPLHCEDGGVFLSVAITQPSVQAPFQHEQRSCQPGAEPLASGATAELSGGGFALPGPGTYELKIDLVDEKEGHTFESMGSAPWRGRIVAR